MSQQRQEQDGLDGQVQQWASDFSLMKQQYADKIPLGAGEERKRMGERGLRIA